MKSLKYSNLPCVLVVSTITLAFVAQVDARRRSWGWRASDPWNTWSSWFGGGSSTSTSDPATDTSDGPGSVDDVTTPVLPVGSLSAAPTVVRAGTHPTLKWSITHPSIIEDYVTIDPPSTIIPDEEVDCEIRILGQGVTVSSGSGYSFVPTEARVSVGNSGYDRVFYGTNNNVDPTDVVWSGTLQQGQSLKFSGRYYYNGSWGTHRKSDGGTNNVRALVNDDTPPAVLPGHDAPSLESFLKPYLSNDGKVQIGPMDSIVFMELTHSDSQQSSTGYDLQDMVLLVTFKSKAREEADAVNNIDNYNSEGDSDSFIDLTGD